MCGIAAWSGSDPKNFDRNKFIILGIWNETRGTDSCGMSVDGVVRKGVNNNKVFRDFVAGTEIPNPELHPTVIAHTRKSSVGLKTKENAHPFSFNDETDSYTQFIGCHNGTLYNYEELADEYGIAKSCKRTIISTHGVKSESIRHKVDSEILLEILQNTDDYSVLEKYNGGAALVWYDTDEPNVMYCYHGKSKRYTNGLAVEERPLYFYQETPNSLYVSSIEESLWALCPSDDLDNIKEFDHNFVYKITDGDVSTAEKIPVNRSEAFQSDQSWSQYSYNGNSRSNSRFSRNNNAPAVHGAVSNGGALSTAVNNKNIINKVINIHYEMLDKPLTSYENKLYFNKFRYWRRGVLVNGVFIYINGYGYFFLGNNEKSAREKFWFFADKEFNIKTGNFITNSSKNKGYVPFETSKITNTPPFTYIYNGMVCKTELDFRMLATTNKIFTTHELSSMTTHPIISMQLKGEINKQNIWKDGRFYTGTFTVLNSNKIYTVKEGNVKDVKTVNKVFSIGINKDVINNAKTKKKVIEMVLDDIQTESSADKIDDLVLEDFEKILTQFYILIPDTKAKVNKYPESKVKTKLLQAIDNIQENLDDVIEATQH